LGRKNDQNARRKENEMKSINKEQAKVLVEILELTKNMSRGELEVYIHDLRKAFKIPMKCPTCGEMTL
jgi:hypothetical protein